MDIINHNRKRLMEDYDFVNSKTPFRHSTEAEFFNALNSADIINTNELHDFLSQWTPRLDKVKITWKDYFNKRAKGDKDFTTKMSSGKMKVDGIGPDGKISFVDIQTNDSPYEIKYNGTILKENRFIDWINKYLPFTNEQVQNLEKSIKVTKEGLSTPVSLANYFAFRTKDTAFDWKKAIMSEDTERLEFDGEKIEVITKPKNEEQSDEASAEEEKKSLSTVQYSFVNKDGRAFSESTFLTAYVKSKAMNQSAANGLLKIYTVYKNGTKITMDEYIKERGIDLDTLTESEVARITNMRVADESSGSGEKSESIPLSQKIGMIIRSANVPVYNKKGNQMTVSNNDVLKNILENPADYFIKPAGKGASIMSVEQWSNQLKSSGAIRESLSEDFTADEMTQSGTLYLNVGIDSEAEDAEFNLDIDELGQIVITPDSDGVSFTGASLLTKNDDNVFVSIDDDSIQKEPTIEIQYTMTSSVDDYNYFVSIDEIGQVIITPESDDTSFVTATVGDNLNISAEDEVVELFEGLESAVATAKIETDNYTNLNGEFQVEDFNEAEIIKSALEMYYDNVELSIEEGICTITYSDNEPTLTEDIDNEEDYPQWEIVYKFADDISDNGKTESTTLGAPSAEDANRYAEQYARMQSEDNAEWKSAKIISLQLIN